MRKFILNSYPVQVTLYLLRQFEWASGVKVGFAHPAVPWLGSRMTWDWFGLICPSVSIFQSLSVTVWHLFPTEDCFVLFQWQSDSRKTNHKLPQVEPPSATLILFYLAQLGSRIAVMGSECRGHFVIRGETHLFSYKNNCFL